MFPQDCKQDENARQAYKHLAALHNECDEIIKTVTNIGLAERESRNLQEQVDMEISKGTSAKLEKVNNDLEEVRKEISLLLKKREQKK